MVGIRGGTFATLSIIKDEDVPSAVMLNTLYGICYSMMGNVCFRGKIFIHSYVQRIQLIPNDDALSLNMALHEFGYE